MIELAQDNRKLKNEMVPIKEEARDSVDFG